MRKHEQKARGPRARKATTQKPKPAPSRSECSGGHSFEDTLKGDGRRARRDWNRDWNRDWSELAPLRATEEGRGVTGTVTEGRP